MFPDKVIKLNGSISEFRAKDDPAQHGDEPYDPDDDAETVEIQDHSFIFSHQDNGCPDGMEQHQQDGRKACDAMKG